MIDLDFKDPWYTSEHFNHYFRRRPRELAHELTVSCKGTSKTADGHTQKCDQLTRAIELEILGCYRAGQQSNLFTTREQLPVEAAHACEILAERIRGATPLSVAKGLLKSFEAWRPPEPYPSKEAEALGDNLGIAAWLLKRRYVRAINALKEG